MSRNKCSFCGATVPNGSTSCHVCGKRVSLINMPKTNSPAKSRISLRSLEMESPLKPSREQKRATIKLNSLRSNDIDIDDIEDIINEDDFAEMYDRVDMNKKKPTLVGIISKIVIAIIVINVITSMFGLFMF